MKRITLLSFASVLLFASCKKSADATSEIQPGDIGKVEIEFDNVVGTTDLHLNTGTYTNAAGEPYTISAFKYYVSNIRLTKTDGSVYAYPKNSSYFLIDESASEHSIELEGVPAGDYNGVSFTIGVDSTKSVAPLGERTGDLDPAGAGADMYWTWNSGYIFLKMEGASPVANTADHKFFYHIGGFGGYNSATINNIKQVSLTAPAGMSAKIRKNKANDPEIHLFADAARVLSGSTNVSIAANPMVMFAPYSVNIANNYQSMFSINHIHND